MEEQRGRHTTRQARGTEKITKRKYEEKKRCGANGTGKDRLKVLYQNGGNKKNTFEYIEQIEKLLNNTRPHVFFMSECRLDEKTKEALEHTHGFSTEEMGPGERIWAAVRNTVPYKRRRDYEVDGFTSIALEFGTGNTKYLVIGVYREFNRTQEQHGRSGERQRARWTKFVDKMNEILTNTKLEVHLMGDFNLATEKWPQLGCTDKKWPHIPLVNEMYDKLINGAGLSLTTPDGITWTNADGTRSSTLDLHFTNNPAKVKTVKTSPEFESDHLSLVMERSESDQLGATKCTKRPWSKVDYIWVEENYREWWMKNVATELSQNLDPEEVAQRLTCALTVMMDSKYPVKSFMIKPNYAPYLNQKMGVLRKEKRRLWVLYKKTGSMEIYKEMRTVTNRLRRITSKARKRYFGRAMQDYRDSEKLWKFAKIQVGWKQDGTPAMVIKDGIRITDPKEVADAVNDELMKKIRDILDHLPPSGVDPLDYTRSFLAGREIPEVEITRSVDEAEVAAAIDHLNITDAAGHDHLTTRLVKSMKSVLTPVLTHLINLCFDQDKMPVLWKLAKISPLFKGGDKFNARNYRPVAVLPALSKVIERVVFSRLQSHLEEHRLLADSQNAYRQKRSVTTAMLQLYDNILAKQDEGIDSACVFLDCSAAFDTIQHSVLLDKLKLYGVGPKSMRWFEDYLKDRAQFVSIGGVSSEIRKIIDGTFQGSLGGPWCFLIIINDIVILGRQMGYTIYIYADDCCLRVDLTGDIAKDQEKLDNIMRDIVQYMNSQKLKFNFGKTEFVVTAPARHDAYKDLVLNFDNKIITQKLHAKLLGLQVSWNLTHDWYVFQKPDNLLAQLSKRMYVLERLANKCPKKCLKNLAHGLIFSKLTFGIQYWSRPMKEEIWNKIQVLVNRAARVVLKIKPLQMHVLDMYRILDWLPVDSLVEYHDMSLFWSIKHYRTPANLGEKVESASERLERESSQYTHSERGGMERVVTRSITQQSINRSQENDSRNSLRAGSFIPRMIRRFNELDPEERSITEAGTMSEEQRWKEHKRNVRNKIQWKRLGTPENWPENRADALLDRGDEIYGLGIDSSTTDSDSEPGPATT